MGMNKTKRAIFEAAIKEFSGNGYTGTSVDNIASTAGVAKGTLYYHFKSKEEIFKYIITEGIALLVQQVKEVEDTGDITLNLKELCKVQLTMIQENRDFFKVIMSQLWGQELRHLELRAVVRNYLESIEGKLKVAVSEGKIKSADSSFMAYYFFGTLCSTAVFEIVNEDADVNQVVEQMMDYLLNGIKLG